MSSEFIPPSEIINTEGKKRKFFERYVSLYKQIQLYIDKSGYNEDVVINDVLLGYTLVDYFSDIDRLKTFHNIEHINSIKLISYTVYWLLRRKPIQLKSNHKELMHVNERFALALVLDFLSSHRKKHLAVRNESGLVAFKELLYYFFKFRQFTAQDIELMLTAFFAGQIYQETDKDLSSFLPSSDYDEIESYDS